MRPTQSTFPHPRALDTDPDTAGAGCGLIAVNCAKLLRQTTF